MQFGLKVRLGLTLSAIWVCLVFLMADSYQSTRSTVGVAALPLVVLWGVGWTLSGWLDRRKSSKAASQSTQPIDRKPAIKYGATVLVVFIIGVLFATWYANHRLQGQASPDIAFMVGQWCFYTALAYAAFRYAPGFTRPIAGLLAAMFFVAGLNYTSYKQVDLLFRTKQSLTAATPLFVKIQSGGILDEADIKSANVGFFEPFLLAVADSNKRLVVAQRRYEKEVNESGFGEVLAPSNLALSGGRVRAKVVIANVERITIEYLTETEASFKAGKASVKSAVLQLPKEYAPVFEGYASTVDDSLKQIQKLRDIEISLLRCANEIVELLDAAPGQIKATSGPQPLLIFSNDETAASYNKLIARFGELARQESQLNEQVMRERINRVERLTDSLTPVN